MTNHKNSKRDPLAEWFKFKMWNSRNDENISPYMAELRRLRQCCGYGDSLECRLRDVNQGASLWCKPGPYSSELLSESADLTLQKALYISLYLVVLWLSCQSEIMQEKLNHIIPNLIFFKETSIGVPLKIKWTNWKSKAFFLFLVYGSSVPKNYMSV